MEIKKKGVKKAQQREASNNYYLWYTHIHIHIQTERQGQTVSPWVVLLEIQQFSKKIVHFCIAKSTLYLHVLHDFQRNGLEWGQTQEKL